jgi:hypothetical protein
LVALSEASRRSTQEDDVEHVVESSAGWKLELVGDLVNNSDDAVRPIVARLELASRGCLE